MINNALDFIRAQLNTYLEIKADPAATNIVQLDNVVDDEGNPNIDNTRVGMTLVNIEEERVLNSQARYVDTGSGRVALQNPEINLNLYVLFSANYQKYTESLKKIAQVITFFQSKNVFDHQNSPDLDPGIEKLIAEIYTLSFESINQMWTTLGGKYSPSIMYKLRMLILRDETATMQGPPIKIVKTEYTET